MKWFKSKRHKAIYKHNLKISENIGMITVDQLSRNASFRRYVGKMYPDFAKKIDFQLKPIRHIKEEDASR